MPKPRPTIASFWVLRPEEHPEAEARNYPGMLQVLQRSCDRLGLRHIVLTDRETAKSSQWPAGIASWAVDLPSPLMQACTEVQAQYLETQAHMVRMGGAPPDTLFCGADCIFVGDPLKFYPPLPGLCVTYRNRTAKYAINTGAILVRGHSVAAVAPIFRKVADRCGTKWCDDQLSLIAELGPMPALHGVHDRQGVKVAFMPMRLLNVRPERADDRCSGAMMLHFRGKAYKQAFFDWAKRWDFA